MTREKVINFDMDGTIANLYADPQWLEKLTNADPTPYINAKPMVNTEKLAKAIHKAQAHGYAVNILTWLAKNATAEYDKAVAAAKLEWLKRYFPTVEWNEIIIATYGTPKHELAKGILFDDEEHNREAWGKGAYTPAKIFKVMNPIR